MQIKKVGRFVRLRVQEDFLTFLEWNILVLGVAQNKKANFYVKNLYQFRLKDVKYMKITI